MRILHTSDWHLGHTLYGYDRKEEQQAMLDQMVELTKHYQPDAFLLCGDVFHTAQPSASVQTLFADTLVRIHEANPSMSIVVTAGNHDSGTKHEIFRTPWRALHVHAIGHLSPASFSEHVIAIPEKGYVVAVPYTYERNLPDGFFSKLLDFVDDMNVDRLPVVLMAHTTVSGCDFTGHEHSSDFTVGGIDCCGLQQLGNSYDYLALGHIHHAQFVMGSQNKARYCGTPIPVSFDETYSHSVSIVDIESHGAEPRVEVVPVENPRPLVTLPSEGTATWDDAKLLLEQFPSDIPAYIRLNVEVDTFLPTGAREEAAALAEGKRCHFCHINAVRPAMQRAASNVMTIAEFQSLPPFDMVRRYAEDIGKSFDETMQALFRDAEQAIRENT